MAQNKQTLEEITQLEILQTITSVYGQLASLGMSKTRDGVIRSRHYLVEMHQVFMTVFSSYADEVRKMSKRRGKSQITFLAHNGKKVAVLLSANTGFYGDIIKKSYDLFINELNSDPDMEATIIGHQGQSLFLSEFPDRPHTFFDLEDERVDQSKLAGLIRHLVQYEEIHVIYGKFQNFVNQDPVVLNISANPYNGLEQQEKPKKYLFEPNIEKILVFFEQQIFSSLFEQSVRESQLAKFASRVNIMDRAGENIKQRLKIIEHNRLKLAHQVANQKQLNQFASVAMWHG